MKKTIAVLLMGLIATSYGVVNVDWGASAGFYFSADSNTGILGPTGVGKSTIAQLMYSPDNVKDSINTSGVGTVNDVVWDTITITENGDGLSEWAYFVPENCPRAFTNGYVYAVIFHDNNLQAGDWYYSTPLLALQNVPPIPTKAQNIEMNTDLNYGDAIDSAYGKQIVGSGCVLTVNSGTGDGSYTNGAIVEIAADAPASGKSFGRWTGDTQYVTDINSPTTTVTMAIAHITITAAYINNSDFTCTTDNGTITITPRVRTATPKATRARTAQSASSSRWPARKRLHLMRCANS